MRCSRVDRLIDRFVDERLPARLAGSVGAHLEACERCRLRAAGAREVRAALAAGALPAAGAVQPGAQAAHGARAARVAAPAGFSSRVMAEVYRLRLDVRRREVDAVPRRFYRRLGYSFVASAAILSASLLIPGIAYSRLIRPEALAVQLAESKPPAFVQAISDAGAGFERMGAGGREAGRH